VFYTGWVTKRTPSAQVRGAVLAAALAILDEEGPDGFTVRAIADRAEVAPMAIYNHFQGTDGLIEQICIDGFELLASHIGIASGDPEADLVSSGKGYRRFALEHPGYFTAIFLHNFKGFEGTPAIERAAEGAYGALVALVARAQETAVVRAGDPEEIATMLWSVCHGFVALSINGALDLGDVADARYDFLLATTLRGLRPE
jgi:AcrR family transcriptional regulator